MSECLSATGTCVDTQYSTSEPRRRDNLASAGGRLSSGHWEGGGNEGAVKAAGTQDSRGNCRGRKEGTVMAAGGRHIPVRGEMKVGVIGAAGGRCIGEGKETGAGAGGRVSLGHCEEWAKGAAGAWAGGRVSLGHGGGCMKGAAGAGAGAATGGRVSSAPDTRSPGACVVK